MDTTRVLYIDDERHNFELVANILEHDVIDAFAITHPDKLSHEQVAALKSIQLELLLNNPPRVALDNVGKIAGIKTPVRELAAKLYNGEVDVLITDMNMPAASTIDDAKFLYGGFQAQKIARVAGVPCIIYTRTSLDMLKRCFDEVYDAEGVLLKGVLSNPNKTGFIYVEKENQLGLYEQLSTIIMERAKAQGAGAEPKNVQAEPTTPIREEGVKI